MRRRQPVGRRNAVVAAAAVLAAAGAVTAVVVVGGDRGGRPRQAQTGCFASPGACGYPDPAYSNVGVPAGTVLKPSGSITVTVPGTVVDGLDVTGTITVAADNVTVRNSRVTLATGGCGPTYSCGSALINMTGTTTLTVQNVELTTAGATTSEFGVRNGFEGKLYLDRVLQRGNIDALCFCANADIRNSYSLIDLAISTDHIENLYVDGDTLVADHNTLINRQPQTANLFANTGNGGGGACANQLTVTNNLLAGGGYSLYPCGNASSAGTSKVTVTGNRFARCTNGGTEVQGAGGTWNCAAGPDSNGFFPRGGSFGVVAYSFPNMVWSGNFWDDNGQFFCPGRDSGCAPATTGPAPTTTVTPPPPTSTATVPPPATGTHTTPPPPPATTTVPPATTTAPPPTAAGLLDDAVTLLKQTTTGYQGHTAAWYANTTTYWYRALAKIEAAKAAGQR